MNDIAGIIGVAMAVLVPLAGLVVWAMRAVVAPLKVTVDNNTQALERWGELLDRHADKLEDHEVRISCIETVHEAEVRR
jgi:cobalamin biosynthesis protein CobD/CbiB